jgi:hypothetical protein
MLLRSLKYFLLPKVLSVHIFLLNLLTIHLLLPLLLHQTFKLLLLKLNLLMLKLLLLLMMIQTKVMLVTWFLLIMPLYPLKRQFHEVSIRIAIFAIT